VAETVATTSSRELTDWQTFDALYGLERLDIAAARVCAIIAAAHGAKDVTLGDYLPTWQSREQTPEEVAQAVNRIFGAMT
jgi:hypothetical protein